MNPAALLIGNGLNRVSTDVAWINLLKHLQEYYDIECSNEYTNFPLEYERIEQAAIQKGMLKENEVKTLLAKNLPVVTDFSLLKQYASLPVDAILTTNYDYNMELSLSCSYDRGKEKSSTRETKHSLFRYTQVADRKIWHIHGEAQCPNTICMGYEQYCSHLSKMHEVLTTPKKGFSNRPYLDHVLLHHDDPNPPWPVLFFTHDLHIIGLQLGLIEIDLWWLLSYRNRLRILRPELNISNKIHYYYESKGCDAEQISLMDSMGVELHAVTLVRNNWKRLYSDVLKFVKSNLDK